jgi:hypothetical protein
MVGSPPLPVGDGPRRRTELTDRVFPMGSNAYAMQPQSEVPMLSLAPVTRIEIHVPVDNATDSLSTVSPHAESEFAYLASRGMRELAGEHLCCACHGLSYFITLYRGAIQHTVLSV